VAAPGDIRANRENHPLLALHAIGAIPAYPGGVRPILLRVLGMFGSACATRGAGSRTILTDCYWGIAGAPPAPGPIPRPIIPWPMPWPRPCGISPGSLRAAWLRCAGFRFGSSFWAASCTIR
jgi:hypothetical protein